MKKWISIFLTCVMLLLLASCKSDVQPDIERNSTIESDVQLTHTYSLADLENFIKNRHSKDAFSPFEENELDLLFYNELNEEFPVEVLKYGEDVAYTVYRVEEGGYYYVFWSHGYPSEETPSDWPAVRDWTDTDHMIVYFSTYLDAYMNIFDFFGLKKGVSTAEDVMKIDPNLEIASLSRGYVSYSLLKNALVLEICYTTDYSENMDCGNLIVKDFHVLPINESLSCFRVVSNGDMP